MSNATAESRVPWHAHRFNLLFLHRLADWGIRIFPLPLCYGVAHLWAELFWFVTPHERGAVMKNLARILGPGVSEQELRGRARRLYHAYALCFVDFLRCPRYKSLEEARLTYAPEHQAYFDSALAAGKGALLVSAHLGNWEVGAALFAVQGYDMTVVVAEEDEAGVNEFIRAVRIESKVEVVVLGKSETAILDVIRALRRNRIVAMLVDREYGSASATVPMLGGHVRFPTGIYHLAKRTGAPVIPAFIVREPGNRYVTECNAPMLLPDTGDSRRDADTFAASLADVFGRHIKGHPEQFFNFFPLWIEDRAVR